uniref:Uncharacterized protein n=2 Tax=Anguilla anguilla TaxID=7936 RepID=A0A0E9S7I9_ANGAN
MNCKKSLRRNNQRKYLSGEGACVILLLTHDVTAGMRFIQHYLNYLTQKIMSQISSVLTVIHRSRRLLYTSSGPLYRSLSISVDTDVPLACVA